MVNCKYILKGLTFNSYTELLNHLDTLNLDFKKLKISDIVYSRVASQTALIEKIKELKAEYVPKIDIAANVSSLVNGEPQVKGAKTILDFIDSESCTLPSGNRLVTPINREDYIKRQIDILSKDMDRELAEKKVAEIIKSWEQIQKDSFALHKLFVNENIQNKTATDVDFINSVKNDIPESLNSVGVLTELFNELKNTYKKEKGKISGSKAFKNINLITKIKGLDEEILGHIDYLFVGEDGTLHLYLFKTTASDPKTWANTKEEKYKYQLAFLKQMLASKGLKVNNMTLNIIPVQLEYNTDYSKVNKVTIHPTKVYSTRHSNAEYAMHKFENQAKAFIKSSTIPFHISDKPIERADEVNKAIFPEFNIRTEGIARSARAWIKAAPNIDPTGTELLVIKEVGEPDHAYDVIINGTVHTIKSAKSKNNNEEIRKVVEQYISDLDDAKGYSTQRLKEAIESSYDHGFPMFDKIQGLRGSATTLNAVFNKYLPKLDSEGKIVESGWKLKKDLIDANVLIFENEDNVVDIISLTAFDLNTLAGFKKGTNILGSHKFDGEYNDLRGDYGNIEAVRTMELLNEILPLLGDVKLGTLGVLSSIEGSSFRKFDIAHFNKTYFLPIISIVENNELKIENNFRAAQFVDPVEAILEEYLKIVDKKSDKVKAEYEEFGFDLLENAQTKYEQMKALQYIMTQILDIHKRFADPEYFKTTLTEGSAQTRNMAILYDLVTKAYLNLSGETPTYLTELDPVNKNLFTAATVPDPNIRIVVNNLQITHDTIASEFLSTFDKDVRPIFDKFYSETGYTAALNMSIGNLAQLYNNLYQRDTMTGENLMIFKNPYDMSNDLKPHERELLKPILYQIALITHNGKFPYDFNDSRLPEYIKAHEEYLWVPLERASKATSRLSAKAITAKMKNTWKRMTKASEAFDEFVNNLTEEERELLGNDNDKFYKMTLTNPFSVSIPFSNSSTTEIAKKRAQMLDRKNGYGPEFFETNVENIMIDFLAKHISTVQLNKLLVTSKALLLQLHLTGNFAGNEEVVEKEVKYIQDYLKVNVFNTSIMSKTEKAIVGYVQPVKHVVTNMLLGGNVVSMFRDAFEGIQQNFIRSLIKLNTDIDPASVRKAYQYVMTHATSNAMAVNLLSKLCLKYRLSNTDVGRITERAKSGRNGIFNYDNWMYGTLRSPDFLNRMTLFVAKCMHDGVWDAYSIDDDNNLVYDWKKDKRFDRLAAKDVNHPDYKKQRSLYLSKIREYNLEHPESPIEPDGDLPTPYSNREIMSIRAVGDNIYGSYDKGKKAMSENMCLGTLFGMFTTWMNGIVNTYFMKPQKNGVSKLFSEQDTDEQGRPLFFTEDGGQTTEDTGVPVLKNVPILMQGIMYTVIDAARMCKQDGIKATYQYIKGNDVAKANMRKLISDILMSFLLAALFKFAVDPAYKQYKKGMKDNPVLLNLVTEILYKSSSRSYDQFKGPINVIQFFGENMNPPFYSTPVEVLKETGEVLMGKKTWKYLIFDNTGFGRSAKDTGHAIYRKSLE